MNRGDFTVNKKGTNPWQAPIACGMLLRRGGPLAKQDDMLARSPSTSECPLPPESIRDQLARILRSQPFSNAPSLSGFLRYVVEHTLDGNTEELKEYSLGVEVFGRGKAFDPRTDTIVASKLAGCDRN